MKTLLILLISVPFGGFAQKLPKVQQTSMQAPANIKIDGKAAEWNDQFQAYNVGNHIYYTVANDDQNLYLALRASDADGNEKAIFGITFTINLPKQQSKSKESVSIRFPTVIEVSKTSPIRNTIHTLKSLENATANADKQKRDSLRLFANKKMNEYFKEMNVTGIKDITEAAIPVYNTEGIKAAAQLSDNMLYTYELAIPLKYLGVLINNGQKFGYNIKMNGMPEKTPDSPFAPPIVKRDGDDFSAPVGAFIMFPTDFSGEYTLAKK